jgi:hypothetical protein
VRRFRPAPAQPKRRGLEQPRDHAAALASRLFCAQAVAETRKSLARSWLPGMDSNHDEEL